ncbi:MAG: hypothetical protein JKX98_08765 [Alcanivoracaceae bacterium]|nr:hypothetical protein [Alcanivoracaceae bacterium]
MSLINCPSCQKKISDKISICPACQFSFNQNESELDRLKISNYRKYRDKQYQFKMLGFFAIAITVFGVIPMLWDYLKALDYGFDVNLINHWGIYPVITGFAMYVFVRILMLKTKRNYKSVKFKQN